MAADALDRRALGLALTRLAAAGPGDLAHRQACEPPAVPARRIGITGPPGAGKSSLLGPLALHRAPRGRIGVLAVDPSSPKTGGAILGDRIRMDSLAGADELYIRSIGSRGSTDGLANSLPEMLDAMDTFGFVELILETVGVGQAEFAARVQVDTLVLVLLPGSGDIVQAMKAGISEVADIVVINKSDLPGAQQMAADVSRIASLSRHAAGDWLPPVVLTASHKPESIAELSEQIDRHQQWLVNDARREALIGERRHYRLQRLLEMHAGEVVKRSDADFFRLPIRRQLTLAIERMAQAIDS